MDFWVSVFEFIASKGEMPKSYDVYHFLWIFITLFLTLLLLCTCKNLNNKRLRIMAGILWMTLVILEIMKQVIFGFTVEDGRLVWNYNWYNFPFQFCASPLYILPFVAFARDGRVRDAAIVFIASFSLFAGICVYVFPNDVLTYSYFVNAQAMFHHGAQIFFGIYLAFRCREKMHLKNLGGAGVIFSTLVGIAMILNEVVHRHLILNGSDDVFNMFFISPYFDCTLPVLSSFYDSVPYPVFLCIYILGFMLCALVVMHLMNGLVRLTRYTKWSLAE